jgi:UDPglucose 6-dehydrogenase
VKISVIGTGYVGLVTGACFADLGHTVICVDVDKIKVASLKRGKTPFFEPGLEEILRRNSGKRLFFTTDTEQAVKKSDIVFIAVSTPPMPSGEADIRNVKKAAETIGRAMDAYKIIVNKSTVPIGMSKLVGDLIRRTARPGLTFDVVSNPEFLREGSAVDDLFHPDRVIIGAQSRDAAQKVAEIYKSLRCNVLIMDPESAEMVKYASNAFLATKISFINEVSNLCEKVGADIPHVVKGMSLDHRIGGQFLSAGLGFGGSCFPKDVAALAHIGKLRGEPFKILPDVLEINHQQRERYVKKVVEVVGPLRGKTLAVWGLAFKPNTDDMREAPSLDILPRLVKMGAKIKAYDPEAMPTAKQVLKRITYCSSPYEAARDADAILLLTEWNEFKEVDFVRLKSLMKTHIVVDGRNLYDPSEMAEQGFQYEGMGRAVHQPTWRSAD